MIYVICLIVSIIGIILAWFFEKNDHDIASLITTIVAIPAILAAMIMTVVIIFGLYSIPDNEAGWQEQYKSLNTRIEQHMYYPWDRAKLVDEVQEWNTDYAARKASHENIWVNIFHLESLEGLEKIDLERIK